MALAGSHDDELADSRLGFLDLAAAAELLPYGRPALGSRMLRKRCMRPEAESSLHQVRIEVAPEHVPDSPEEREALTERLLELAQTWATERIAERHTEV